jgi:hypothetical protein
VTMIPPSYDEKIGTDHLVRVENRSLRIQTESMPRIPG